MATIKDVAKQAGVSLSTASAALNRSAPLERRPKSEIHVPTVLLDMYIEGLGY